MLPSLDVTTPDHVKWGVEWIKELIDVTPLKRIFYLCIGGRDGGPAEGYLSIIKIL